MHSIQMRIGKKNYDCIMPSTWEEITWEEWKAIAAPIFDGKLFSRRVIASLLKKDTFWGHRKLPKKVINQIPTEGLYPLYGALDWLHLDNCIFPPFEFVRIGKKKFYLPSARLENATIVEFALLDMAWELSRFYDQRNQPDKAEYWLTRLCTYMCRPIDKRINHKDPETYMGDRREKINTAIIDLRIPIFEKMMDPRYRFGCIFFFLGCKKYIHKRYKGTLWHDTHDVEGNEIIGVQKDDKPQPMRWMNIIRKLAGGKFGNLRETQFANLYDVLDELRDQVKASRSN